MRTLYWYTPSLIPGQTYRVRVRASRNNGSTWCPWGAECLVTIAPNVAPEGGSSNFDAPVAEQRLSIWPNPNNGSNLEVNIQGLDRNAVDAQVVVYDATGKLVYQDQFAVEAPIWRSTIAFEGTLPQGTYLLRVVSGEKYWNERFVVAQ
ncbi:MAG: T9SS type A sorting domain-containing protein [Flavobacteriales bacterium]|nr:T9SS type A sorting domain-containing protein [Flavobacteriales bacterium]